jgi:hypothetical protein
MKTLALSILVALILASLAVATPSESVCVRGAVQPACAVGSCSTLQAVRRAGVLRRVRLFRSKTVYRTRVRGARCGGALMRGCGG